MAKEWKLEQNVEKMISNNEANLLASYRFALYKEAPKSSTADPEPIGLLQNIQIQESRMNQPVSEIGSLLPKYLPGPFQGSLSLSKVLIFNESILSATHNNVNKLEMDLLETFGRATNFILIAFDPSDATKLNDMTGSGAKIVGKARIEKAKIQNKSLNITAGQPVVIESASFQFVKIEDIA